MLLLTALALTLAAPATPFCETLDRIAEASNQLPGSKSCSVTTFGAARVYDCEMEVPIGSYDDHQRFVSRIAQCLGSASRRDLQAFSFGKDTEWSSSFDLGEGRPRVVVKTVDFSSALRTQVDVWTP